MTRPSDTPSPRMSVVIPSLPNDSFLPAAVASVVADCEGIDFEVIVVIDGPDGLLPPSLMDDRRVRIAHTGKRSGAAVAINRGVALSRGEYIGRLDSDDLWLPGRARAQLELLDSSRHVGLVAGNANVISAEGALLGRYPRLPPASQLRASLLKANPILHSSITLRRDLLVKAGGYDPELIRMQDYDMLLRLALITEFASVDVDVASYRLHEQQSSKVPHNFFGLMRTISRRRNQLALHLGHRRFKQAGLNLAYGTAQLLRYARLRRPRYLTRLEVQP